MSHSHSGCLTIFYSYSQSQFLKIQTNLKPIFLFKKFLEYAVLKCILLYKPTFIYLRCIECQHMVQQHLCMGGQTVVQQQVSSIGEGHVMVRRRSRVQYLTQALQGTTAVAFGLPKQSCLIVDQPVGYSGLNKQISS